MFPSIFEINRIHIYSFNLLTFIKEKPESHLFHSLFMQSQKIQLDEHISLVNYANLEQ